jgi:hypothetical protein
MYHAAGTDNPPVHVSIFSFSLNFKTTSFILVFFASKKKEKKVSTTCFGIFKRKHDTVNACAEQISFKKGEKNSCMLI